jgi:AAA domain
VNSAAPIDLVLERLPDARKAGAGWTARCPAHDDARPSLSISLGEASRVLLHCYAGCTSDAVVERLGLSMADLFVSAQPRSVVRAERKPRVTRYEIRDIEGILQAVHVRTDGPHGKTFTWEGPDGTSGLSGRSSSSLLLYRAETLNGTSLTEPVIVTEGEAAADALATIWPGLIVATVTGAASIPSVEALEALRGHTVVLWPDRDDPGTQHMERLGMALPPIVSTVRLLDVPRLPDHGDAADYVRAGRGGDELVGLVNAAADVSAQTSRAIRAGRSLRFRTAREVAAGTAASVPWRARPYLVDGAVLEVVGKIKAAGKTTFVTFMCRAILDGTAFLGEPTVQGGVIYLTEQQDSSLRETLRRAGLLDRDDFVVLAWTDTGTLSWPEVVTEAVAEAERRSAKVLVVDTLTRFAGIHGDGENNAGDADAASAPLLRAAANGLAVVSVRHERKAGGDVGDSGRGSSAF